MSRKYSLFLFFVLFGGVFVTSEHFMNAENDPKAYIIKIGSTLVVLICSAFKKEKSCLSMALTGQDLYVGITIVSLCLSVYGILQYAGVTISRHASFPITGLFENPAGFAAVQTAVFPFVCSLCLEKGKRKVLSFFAIATLVLCILTVILSGSRAGMLAVCVAACVRLTFKTELMQYVKKHRWICLPIILIMVALPVLLYYMKTDSANGRLFVWGRCLELISERPLLGHGMNGFSKCYMEAQAAYFSTHPDSPYVMLADNITHPFNEYLKLAVDFGIIGIVAAVSLLGYLIVRLVRTDGRIMVTGLAVVASVFVFSQFSYPFHYAAVWYVASIAIMPAFLKMESATKTYNSRTMRSASIALLVVLMAIMLRSMYLDMKWAEMSKRSLAGNTERMLPYYEKMRHQMKRNPLFLYNFAAELNYVGRYEESLAIAEECKTAWNDYDVQILLADNLENTGRIDEAIDVYGHAADMIPCRFEPLNSMMALYLSSGDTLSAVRIAETIISKPVKVESLRIWDIKSDAKRLLDACLLTEITSSLFMTEDVNE